MNFAKCVFFIRSHTLNLIYCDKDCEGCWRGKVSNNFSQEYADKKFIALFELLSINI